MSSIKRGQKGAAVLLLQGILHKLNYDITDVDGIFGSETEDAVKSLQSDLGLDDDGVIGKNTANAIVSELWASDEELESSDDEDWGDSDDDWDDDATASNDEDWGDDSEDGDDDWGDSEDDDYDSV